MFYKIKCKIVIVYGYLLHFEAYRSEAKLREI